MPGAPFTPVRLQDLTVSVSLSAEAQGGTLYRGANKWNNLPAGTAGYYLKTNGPGANPEWAAISVSPGGSNGQLQYNNAGAFGGLASTAVATLGSLITVTAPAVTDIPLTLVGHASHTADIQVWKVGSTTIARLSPTTLFVKDGSVSAPGLAFVGQPSLGLFRITGTDIGLCYASQQHVKMGISGVTVAAGGVFNFTSSVNNAGAGVDIGLARDSAGKLVITNGSTGAGSLVLRAAGNIEIDTTTGTKIGTATGQKIAFWNTTPVAQQVLATGAGAAVDDVITLLQTIGLCRQS